MQPIKPCNTYHAVLSSRELYRGADGKSAFKVYFCDIVGRKEPARTVWAQGGLTKADFLKSLGSIGVQVRVAQRELGYRADKRYGAAEFVRGIGSEAVNSSHGGLEPGQHFVAGLGQARDLVARLVDGKPMRQIADGDGPHCAGETADRTEDTAAEQVTGERRHSQQRRDGGLKTG